MPVRFDHAAADAAVRELVLTAGALESMLALLANDAGLVTDGWTGRHRTTFDAESTRHSASMVVLADSLRSTATAIRAKQFEARAAAAAEAALEDGN